LVEPAGFSEEETMIMLALSLPTEKDRRGAFLNAVAKALAASPVRGPGAAHRIAREVQREFFIPPRMDAAGEMGARSRTPRQGFALRFARD
jgi:hypothetical protein